LTTVTVRARGGASKYEIWSRYRDPQRWPTWSPQIARVHAEGALRPGLEGELEGRFGVRARFDVLEVDERAMRWAWTVRIGPARLEIDHDVSEGYAAATIHGPAPLVLVYAPLAKRALRRLAASEPAPGR
jgi:hypothetical protein